MHGCAGNVAGPAMDWKCRTRGLIAANPVADNIGRRSNERMRAVGLEPTT